MLSVKRPLQRICERLGVQIADAIFCSAPGGNFLVGDNLPQVPDAVAYMQ